MEKNNKIKISMEEKEKINVKKEKKKVKSKFKAFMFSLAVAIFLSSTEFVYADAFDNVTAEISKWAIRLGGLLAFYGGIQVAMGMQSEDAGSKRRGVLELVGGLMVVGFAIGYRTIFGL